MALNIITDQAFNEALEWLSKKERKTKSDIIRELVLEQVRHKKQGFRFGAMKNFIKDKKISRTQILKELKSMDQADDIG